MKNLQIPLDDLKIAIRLPKKIHLLGLAASDGHGG